MHQVIKEIKAPREALVHQELLVSQVHLDLLANLVPKDHLDFKVHQDPVVLAVLSVHLEIVGQLVVWGQVDQLAQMEILVTRDLLADPVHQDNRVSLVLLDQADLREIRDQLVPLVGKVLLDLQVL